MTLNYKYAESGVKPEEIEICTGGVYLRKDISAEEREQEDGSTVTMYTYQECRLSAEEFAQAAAALNLSAAQENEDNMLDMMEAITEVAEAVMG